MWKPYAKALVAVAVAAATAAQLAFQDGAWTQADSVTVALAAITAILVYLVPNR